MSDPVKLTQDDKNLIDQIQAADNSQTAELMNSMSRSMMQRVQATAQKHNLNIATNFIDLKTAMVMAVAENRQALCSVQPDPPVH